MTAQTALTVIASFWIMATVSLWWNHRSWFPFTVLAPLVLFTIATGIDRFLPGVGYLLVVCVHGFLWLMLLWFVLGDWNKLTRHKASPEGSQTKTPPSRGMTSKPKKDRHNP